MQRTGNTGGSGSEALLELKYCERCGSLCLRPAGGGQIYCRDCAPAIAELPRATNRPDEDERSGEALWDEDDGYCEGFLVHIIDRNDDAEDDLDTKEEPHEWIH